MKAAPFEYHAPRAVADAVAALEQAGTGARVLAGGQSLVPMLVARQVEVDALVDINGVEGLDRIDEDDEGLRIGATARQADVEANPAVRARYPLLRDALQLMASAAVRHRGTVVGSLANAEPSAELPATLSALGAEVTAIGPGGERRIAVRDLCVGPNATVLAFDELLTEVRVPRPVNGAAAAILEVNRRHNGSALAGAAVIINIEDGVITDGVIALFGVAETPVIVDTGALSGAAVGSKESHQAVAQQAVDGLTPPSDALAASNYRRRAARVLVERTLGAAVAKATG